MPTGYPRTPPTKMDVVWAVPPYGIPEDPLVMGGCGVSPRRCHAATTVAEERLLDITRASSVLREDPRPPGCLHVGGCDAALQWAGCHATVVVNASDKGYYKCHNFCVGFWMNLNYRGTRQGVTWEMRLDTCVWLVLTALAAGHTVLIHCRQGKRCSGALAMLIITSHVHNTTSHHTYHKQGKNRIAMVMHMCITIAMRFLPCL